MRLYSMRALLTSGVIIVFAFSAGLIAGHRGVFAQTLSAYGFSAFAAGAISDAQPQADFSPVWKAWNVIDERFVDAYATSTDAIATTTPEEAQDRIWGMIQGLAGSLNDPYTVFLPPSEAEVFNDDISGSFEGVGMEISIRDNTLTVVSPLKGTPASESGIKSGDRILEIDGKATKGISIDAAVQRIRGPKGTDVTFTILRDGASELRTITVTRDVIEIPTIETTQLDNGIFVVELLNFSAKSPDLFRQALREFIDSGSDKLVVDLRGNPGGYLEAAVDMASWFLPSGKIVVTEDYGTDQDTSIHRSRGYDVFNENLELVILIDGGSASASEILAGSLQEHGVATLVGTNSFGKGSVQELVDITPDTSLKLTVARWLLAGDVFITREGIEPDIVVTIPDDADPDTDYILDAAVEFLQNS